MYQLKFAKPKAWLKGLFASFARLAGKKTGKMKDVSLVKMAVGLALLHNAHHGYFPPRKNMPFTPFDPLLFFPIFATKSRL